MAEPYFRSGPVTLYHGDCIEVMRTLPDASVHAVVTDPPYGLEFMGKDWDGADGFRRSLNAADAGRESVFGRTSKRAPEYNTGRGARVAQERASELTEKGRGHSTSAGPYLAAGVDSIRVAGLPFQEWCAVWAAECLRVLKPGGYMLAFGGSRTWHRLSVAIEDSGFEIRDTIAWLYGSGFPKGTNLDGEFAGWGTGLKPAYEPIVVARKPLGQTVAASMAEHGTGAINIGATRVGSGEGSRPRIAEASSETRYTESGGTNFAPLPGVRGGSPEGRWPANVLLEQSQADALDAETGILTSGTNAVRTKVGKFLEHGGLGKPGDVQTTYGDSGGASRYFPTFHYEAKAPGTERPDVDGVQHPTVKPLDLMRWLVRLVASPGAVILEPFAGSGTTLEAAIGEGFDVIGIERDATYLPLIMQRLDKPHEQTLDIEVTA